MPGTLFRALCMDFDTWQIRYADAHPLSRLRRAAKGGGTLRVANKFPGRYLLGLELITTSRFLKPAIKAAIFFSAVCSEESMLCSWFSTARTYLRVLAALLSLKFSP